MLGVNTPGLGCKQEVQGLPVHGAFMMSAAPVSAQLQLGLMRMPACTHALAAVQTLFDKQHRQPTWGCLVGACAMSTTYLRV